MTREEAIEVLKDIYNYKRFDTYTTNEARTMAIKALEQEPKVGHWVEKEYHFENCWAECSICGKTASGESTDTGWGFEYSFTDYCPNCGAKMIESDEESEAAE